ncbi:MAG: hypothetical protein IIU03_05660, partial [Bacteroidales bacterium]|nr:hypothetical protein [Bacteroidales bacterium]
EEPGTESFSSKACKIICDGLKEAGFTAGVYSSTYWWNTYLNILIFSVFTKFLLPFFIDF